ncbi:MAG TPA: CBS domain-containing protein [candidate division Zixibacteria bacterium]|nr:CBS domain-containing protein [candidate division Zixibacteria bacterium]
MNKGISNDSKIKMEISEVMTSSVYSIFPNDSVEAAAKLMLENNVGSIILAPGKAEKSPLGIITERDIVTRVVALGLDPAKVVVGDIATKPVVTAPQNLDIKEAMKLMARMNIRRLIVVEDNIVIGIVTYRDLLRVAPSLIEIALEYERINFQEDADDGLDYKMGYEDYDKDSDSTSNDSHLSLGFYCSQCGEWNEGSSCGDDDDQPLCGDCYSDEE